MSLSPNDRQKVRYVMFPVAVLRHESLSSEAKVLMGLLLDYARRKGQCFPGTERLRKCMGCSERTLRRAMRELQRAGMIQVRRRGLGRTNLYIIDVAALAGPDQDVLADQDREDLTDQKRDALAGPDRHAVAPSPAKLAGSDRARLSGPLETDKDRSKQSRNSSSTNGNAGAATSDQIEEARRALEQAGVAPGDAARYAAKDAGMALAVVRWLPTRKNLDNPAGFLVDLLSDPKKLEKYGFRRGDDGAWKAPKSPTDIQGEEKRQREKEEYAAKRTEMERNAKERSFDRWERLGRPLATDDERASRRVICDGCDRRDAAGDRCREIVAIGAHETDLVKKTTMATEECPCGKWQSTVDFATPKTRGQRLSAIRLTEGICIPIEPRQNGAA